MEKQRAIKEIQNRRKSRRRKKIFVQTLSIVLLLLIIATIVVLSLKINNNGTSNNEHNMNVVETTVVPTEKAEITLEPTVEPTVVPVTEKPIGRRGTWEAVPDNIKNIMRGCSLPQNASVTFDDLAYLTIPHYDFRYEVVEGHLIVNVQLADEVLDIFAKLFDIKYPIERMQLVDYYDADDFLSIEHNNTSAFNYRESTDGSGRLSKHALGCAIDINPQINPYVNSNGTGAHQNASEFWSRDVSSWSDEIAKAAYIGKNTEIYEIFVNEYGWEWGGSWSSYRDYQHFQKAIY